MLAFTYSPAEVTNNGSQTVTLTLRASDGDGLDDLHRAEFDLSELGGPDDRAVTEHTNGYYVATVLIHESVTPGDKLVTAVVFDRNQETAETSIVVVILDAGGEEGEEQEEGEDGGVDISGVDPIVVIFVIVIIVMLIVAVVIFLKRR